MTPIEVLKEHYKGKVLVDLEYDYTDDPDDIHTRFALLPSKIDDVEIISPEHIAFISEDGHQVAVEVNENVKLEDPV